MLAESKRLEAEINSLRLKLSGLPEGKLLCAHNGKYTKWYQSNGKAHTYIPKSNLALAEALAEKKYLTLLIQDLTCEKNAIDFYLKHHSSNLYTSEQFLIQSPEHRKLLTPFFSTTSTQISDWINSPYEKNSLFPEQLIHKTGSGIYVRSKSESLIGTLLYINKIPFRYECALHLGETVLYPDFTILHPRTLQLYYWEHFGLMDNPSYRQNACSKIQLYSSHEILPSHHLITTFESKDQPLDTEYVRFQIEHFFK